MPKGKRWMIVQTVADGSKAAMCGAVGGRELCDREERHLVIRWITVGAVKSCGARGRC